MSETATRPEVRTAQAHRLRAAVRALVHRFSLSERADVDCCGLTVAQAATLEALRGSPPLRLGAPGRPLRLTPSPPTPHLPPPRPAPRGAGRGRRARGAPGGGGGAAGAGFDAPPPAGERAAAQVERRE